MNNDYISRQAALNIRFNDAINEDGVIYVPLRDFTNGLKVLPSAQTEPHYCRECKWSRCYINVVDKHGESEAYWRCINWSAETDEEGYCHEWKRRTDG